MPRSAAAMAIDRAPLTGRTLPSRANSPTTAQSRSCSGNSWPVAVEQAQGDGQVEASGVFTEVGGGQIDDGAAGVAGVAEVDQGAFDAVDALLDRRLGQADQDGLGQPGGDVHLGLDGGGVDADERERVQLGQHGRLRKGTAACGSGSPPLLPDRAALHNVPPEFRWGRGGDSNSSSTME